MSDPLHKRFAVLIVAVFAMLAGSVYLFARPVPPPTPPAVPPNPAMITWTPTSTEAIVSPGAAKTLSVSFVSSKNIRRASIIVSPELVTFIQTDPASFERIRKGQQQTLNLIIAPSASSTLGTIAGSIQLLRGKVDAGDTEADDEDRRDAGKLLPQTLKVAIDVWNRVTDATAGFSIVFPPSLYNLTDANSTPDSFNLESSPTGVAIGGAVPAGSPVATSGFAVGVDATLFTVSSAFDITQYLNSEYPNSAADANVTPTTVCGKSGYKIFFSGEETGNWPVVIVYQNGRVYRFLYSSTDNNSDQTGLKAFNDVIANCSF
jgi:hypothetical protein